MDSNHYGLCQRNIQSKVFNDLNWEGKFQRNYLDIVIEKPRSYSTAHFRHMYDMIASHGYKKYVDE